MHKSSTISATCGNKSLTGNPLSPYRRNFHGLLSRFPCLANVTFGRSNGGGLPWSRSSIGFGSNVSTCDGPPFMNRNTIRLARGVKWGDLAANGSGAAGLVPADLASSPRAWSTSIALSAKCPKPTADVRSKSRRDSPRCSHMAVYLT